MKILYWLVFFSLITIGVSIYLGFKVEGETLSHYGDLFSGVGSLLAVIWFSGGLYYQATELREQRQQFSVQLDYLRLTSKREAMIAVKQILKDAETLSLSQCIELNKISDIVTVITKSEGFQIFMESLNPNQVSTAYQTWLPREQCVRTMLSGIKYAAETYYDTHPNSEIDFNLEPDYFVVKYGQILWKLPYFREYSYAQLSATFLVSWEPALKSGYIAYLAAQMLQLPDGIIRSKEFKSDLQEHVDKGFNLPAIASALPPEFQVKKS